MKNLPTDEGDEIENRKIISVDIVNEKNLPTWTKDRERKTEKAGERRDMVWSMKELDDKGLG